VTFIINLLEYKNIRIYIFVIGSTNWVCIRGCRAGYERNMFCNMLVERIVRCTVPQTNVPTCTDMWTDYDEMNDTWSYAEIGNAFVVLLFCSLKSLFYTSWYGQQIHTRKSIQNVAEMLQFVNLLCTDMVHALILD